MSEPGKLRLVPLELSSDTQLEVKKLAERLGEHASKGAFLIGIDGCGGAGKSAIAEQLCKQLPVSQLIHIDDFYKPKEDRVQITDDTPVHINFEFERLKEQVLEPLRRGISASYQRTKGEIITIIPEGYVIVEGLGTLGSNLRDSFDYKIWVSSPDEIRRARGIKRDGVEGTKIWDEEYLPQDARYVKEQEPQKETDWVIHNSGNGVIDE